MGEVVGAVSLGINTGSSNGVVRILLNGAAMFFQHHFSDDGSILHITPDLAGQQRHVLVRVDRHALDVELHGRVGPHFLFVAQLTILGAVHGGKRVVLLLCRVRGLWRK